MPLIQNSFLKLLVFTGFLLGSCVAAGLYGAIHDQISYSLSPEYFTKFKFIQFGLHWAFDSPRLGAAVVGFLATWWMAIPIGGVLGVIGFLFRSPAEMARNLATSILVTLAIAVATGFAGLAYGFYQIDGTTIIGYKEFIRTGVIDQISFMRVGFMHNGSYLGGLLGLFGGICFLFVKRFSGRSKRE